MLRIVFLMGTTCSGKGTFCDYVKDKMGSAVYVIGVGAILRKLHTAEYFTGLGAQEKTEKEVWQIFDEEYQRAVTQPGVRLVIVDGQPRLPIHCINFQAYANPFVEFVHVMFYASAEIRKGRIQKRFPYDPTKGPEFNDEVAAKQKLAFDRITNDVLQLFEVWSKLNLLGQSVTVVNTEMPAETYCEHLLIDIVGRPAFQEIVNDKLLIDANNVLRKMQSLPSNYENAPPTLQPTDQLTGPAMPPYAEQGSNDVRHEP